MSELFPSFVRLAMHKLYDPWALKKTVTMQEHGKILIFFDGGRPFETIIQVSVAISD